MKTRRHKSHPSMTSSPCTRILGSLRICQRVSYGKSSIKPAREVGGGGGYLFQASLSGGGGLGSFSAVSLVLSLIMSAGSFFQTAAGNRGL